MIEDEVIAHLRAKVGLTGTPESVVAEAETRLGFSLPPLLRRVYREVGPGGHGPGHGLLSIDSSGGGDDGLVGFHGRTATDPRWPGKILAFCDWGCAIWSALDCICVAGLVVTVTESGFHTQGHTLSSWLTAWVEDVDLWSEMMEPGATHVGINPFTKEPHAFPSAGRPRGTRWP